MRALFILSLILTSNIAVAQKTSDIPLKARQSLAHEYTDPKHIKWEVEKDGYEVSFIYHGIHMSLSYDKDCNLVERETRIAVDNLPDAARKYAEGKGSIKEAARIVKTDGTVNYEAQVSGVDYIFDADGKFLKQAKD